MSGIYFVVTGIQYWLPDYMNNILNVDPGTSTIYFSIMSISAPVSGVIVGGLLTNYVGGYEHKNG